MLITVNITVPKDLPVTKAQQGHLVCIDEVNNYGFIVGNTFDRIEYGTESAWTLNNYIFLVDSADTDSLVNNFDPKNLVE